MRVLLALALLWICVGCSSWKTSYITPLPDPHRIAEGRAPTATESDEIMEAVFRHMCQPKPEVLEESHHVNLVHKVYFIAVGSWQDPSAVLLKRLADLRAPVKPISCAESRNLMVFDKATGERGAAFCVRRISVQSPTRAEVEAVLDPGGGLQSSGPAFRLVSENGRWTVVSSWLLWIS